MSKTTTNLQLSRRWFDLPVPAAATICIFALLAIAGLLGKIHTAPSVAAVPTPALLVVIATPQPMPTAVPIQVAAVLSNALRRAVVAYDSPNGRVIGAIEQGRAYRVLARFGADWLQADVTGSGVVWLQADQVLDLPAGLADLQPAPQPQVIYVASEPQAAPTPQPATYQVTNDQPTDFYTTPPQVDPAAQQALIGSDPNALACGGSPMCGGLTNAQAQAALDAQQPGR